MMATTYRETEGGYDVLKDGAAAGTVPFGTPRAEEIAKLAVSGQITIAPAIPIVEPEAPSITVEQLAQALIAKGVLVDKDIKRARELS